VAWVGADFRMVRSSLSAAVLVAITAIACSAPPSVPDPALPSRLVAAVTGEGAFTYLTELQRITDASGGHRAPGSPGYDTSVEYVAGVLRDAGYDVQTPSVTVRQFAVTEEWMFVDGVPFEVKALGHSPSTPPGGVYGPLGVMSGEGCAPADAAALRPGSVALVRWGTCTVVQKAANAAAAGAAAVLVINTDDVPLVGGRPDEEATAVVPAGGVSRLDGAAIAGHAGAPVTLVLATAWEATETRNVIAQTRTGDPAEVVMTGAHLDSVPNGAGINDNGSGVAALLEIAVRLGGSPPVANAVRFAFWGAEEVGLVGSTTYVQGLAEADHARIALYLNLDMLASPNTAYFVLDGDDSDHLRAGPGPKGSATIERVLVEGLAAAGATAGSADLSGRSDYAPFVAAGIPSGGLFTGAEELKTPEEARRGGGIAGAPYDPCNHQACDRIDMIDRAALDRNTDAAASAVARFALSTAELTAR
jgi:Zn-dependent M28 family amino/carboxypeptidase